MMASNPDENAERLYLREQIARFDQMHERIWRMREES